MKICTFSAQLSKQTLVVVFCIYRYSNYVLATAFGIVFFCTLSTTNQPQVLLYWTYSAHWFVTSASP